MKVGAFRIKKDEKWKIKGILCTVGEIVPHTWEAGRSRVSVDRNERNNEGHEMLEIKIENFKHWGNGREGSSTAPRQHHTFYFAARATFSANYFFVSDSLFERGNFSQLLVIFSDSLFEYELLPITSFISQSANPE